MSLIQGEKGIFEVRADGDLIYSKKACGDRFPAGPEVVAALRARQSRT